MSCEFEHVEGKEGPEHEAQLNCVGAAGTANRQVNRGSGGLRIRSASTVRPAVRGFLMLNPGSSTEAMTFVGTAVAFGLFIGFGFSCLKQHLRRQEKSSSVKRSAWWLMRGPLGGVLAGVVVAYYRSAPAIPSRVLLSLNVLVFVFVGLFLGWCRLMPGEFLEGWERIDSRDVICTLSTRLGCAASCRPSFSLLGLPNSLRSYG
jgi:hypothetical protein